MPKLRFLLALLLLLPAAAGAQQTTQPQKSQFDREMTVSPAKADQGDSFAFSQEALLPLVNQNAAPLYLQALPLVFGNDAAEAELRDKLEEIGIHELDPADARRQLAEANYPEVPYEITEPAVRRTWADWGAPISEKGIATLLPYLAESRNLARSMAMEARLLALEGKHDEAADMLRRLFVLGQHLGNAREPVLIDGLVGVGISALALDRTMQIGELEDAPNRYWALTTLPSPMFDVSRWMRSERIFITATFPAFQHPDLMDARRWFESVSTLEQFSGQPPIEASPVAEAARVFLATVQATDFLKSKGYTEEQIAGLDLFPTAARMMIEDYYSTFDDFSRLVHLPFPQSYPLMKAFEQRLAEEAAQTPATTTRSLAAVVLPSMSRAVESPYRLERQVAMLRIVEAIRDYAAASGGRPPASLDELRLPSLKTA
jgi:hypothetical protein